MIIISNYYKESDKCINKCTQKYCFQRQSFWFKDYMIQVRHEQLCSADRSISFSRSHLKCDRSIRVTVAGSCKHLHTLHYFNVHHRQSATPLGHILWTLVLAADDTSNARSSDCTSQWHQYDTALTWKHWQLKTDRKRQIIKVRKQKAATKTETVTASINSDTSHHFMLCLNGSILFNVW